jgi:PEP-CTERM motif
MVKQLVISNLCLLLALTVCAAGYAVSLPELPDQALAGDAIGIAPGLNDTTPATDIIPGESLRNIPDIPDNDGGKPDDLPGNQGISDLVMEIAPGPAGTAPVSGDFIPGELIRELKVDGDGADSDIVGDLLLLSPLTVPMGGAIVVPEPATLIMVAAAVVGMLRRR